MIGLCGGVITEILTGAEVPFVPRLSVAIAVRTYVPSARLGSNNENGAELETPAETPLVKNCTLLTPLETETSINAFVPAKNICPSVGLVMEIDGGT